jgi:beta-RFAP synthase
LVKVCSVLAGEDDPSLSVLARRAGRGLRSAVGIYGFGLGGLIVEAGKLAADEISPLAARVEFPAAWRVVLVAPRGAAGISGTDESRGFSRLAPMPESLTDHLCRIALTEILPAATQHNFARTSESIGQFGRLVGEYFAPVQGGIFAHEKMRGLAAQLTSRGIRGVGQTSWGPTLFILTASEQTAHELVADLAHEPQVADCEITIAAPLNRGAKVEKL